MIRTLLSIGACLALTACGDGRGSAYSSQRAAQPVPAYIPVTPGATPVSAGAAAAPPAVRFATGPIYSACRSSDRRAATRERCGCVQWVADRELSASDQRRGAGYFSNQHGLQEVRQSSERVRSNGDFWAAWKAYGESAARQCAGT